MNITEFMSFDFAWFTTLPGMLITGGVVVLLIALIIFIASNKKDKKKSAEVASDYSNGNVPSVGMDNTMMAPGVGVASLNNMNPVMDIPMNNDMSMNNGAMQVPSFGMDNMNGMGNMGMTPSVNMNNSFGSVGMDNNTMNAIPSVSSYDAQVVPTNVVDFSTPAQSVVSDNVSIPSVENTMGNNEVTNFNVNNFGQEVSTIPSVTPMETAPSVNASPVTNEGVTPNMEMTPAVEVSVETPVMQDFAAPVQESVAPAVERPAIYGGVDPVNTVIPKEEVKPVIYGGANPLENTTTIPVMNHEAYNMNTPVVPADVSTNVVEPNVSAISTPSYNQTPESPVAMEEPTPFAPVNPAPMEAPNVTVPSMPEVMPAPTSPTMASPMPNERQDVVMPTSMPMTGAEMFGSIDNSATPVSAPMNDGNEIETLEF